MAASTTHLTGLTGLLCVASICFGLVGCDDATAPGGAIQQTASLAGAPTQPRINLDQLISKTFDDIKFDIEPDAPYDPTLLTDAIRQLNGQRIRLRGYILPTAQKRGIKQFVLVRDNQECCFGPGAALYDCVLVEMQGESSAEFSMRSVSVEGRFAIKEFPGPDGRPLAIYRLAGEQVN